MEAQVPLSAGRAVCWPTGWPPRSCTASRAGSCRGAARWRAGTTSAWPRSTWPSASRPPVADPQASRRAAVPGEPGRVPDPGRGDRRPQHPARSDGRRDQLPGQARVAAGRAAGRGLGAWRPGQREVRIIRCVWAVGTEPVAISTAYVPGSAPGPDADDLASFQAMLQAPPEATPGRRPRTRGRSTSSSRRRSRRSPAACGCCRAAGHLGHDQVRRPRDGVAGRPHRGHPQARPVPRRHPGRGRAAPGRTSGRLVGIDTEGTFLAT